MVYSQFPFNHLCLLAYYQNLQMKMKLINQLLKHFQRVVQMVYLQYQMTQMCLVRQIHQSLKSQQRHQKQMQLALADQTKKRQELSLQLQASMVDRTMKKQELQLMQASTDQTKMKLVLKVVKTLALTQLVVLSFWVGCLRLQHLVRI